MAFHSSAVAEAEFLGLSAELAEFRDERTLVRDLLWYADMTTGPDGQCMTFESRMAEVRKRYPAEHYVVRALGAGSGRSAKSFWLVMRCFEGWGAGLGCSGAGVGCS